MILKPPFAFAAILKVQPPFMMSNGAPRLSCRFCVFEVTCDSSYFCSYLFPTNYMSDTHVLVDFLSWLSFVNLWLFGQRSGSSMEILTLAGDLLASVGREGVGAAGVRWHQSKSNIINHNINSVVLSYQDMAIILI